MKKHNLPKGARGEELAAKFLQKKGFKILEKNWRTKFGEIDLVCTKNNILIFVEVKLKIGDTFGTPEEMVTKRKLSQVRRTAESYLLRNPDYQNLFPQQRIDVVAIVQNPDGTIDRIDHYENLV